MHADLELSQSFIESNDLVVFQPVIINNRYSCAIGISKASHHVVSNYAFKRFMLSPKCELNISLPKKILAAKRLGIIVKYILFCLWYVFNSNDLACLSKLLCQSLLFRLRKWKTEYSQNLTRKLLCMSRSNWNSQTSRLWFFHILQGNNVSRRKHCPFIVWFFVFNDHLLWGTAIRIRPCWKLKLLSEIKQSRMFASVTKKIRTPYSKYIIFFLTYF